MPGTNVGAPDEFITRMQNELREKRTFVAEIVQRAQNANRDLDDSERDLIAETRGRMESIQKQLETVQDVSRVTFETEQRARQIGDSISTMRRGVERPAVEYRSAGEYALDLWRAQSGNREAMERLDVYQRAADHMRTTDEAGVIPDPIVGPIINFIDAARPIVNSLGVKPLQYETFHRPHVLQHTAVGPQGTAGLAADEKSELVSQKLKIERLNVTANTYGGYVNISRQSIDFSQPGVLDAVINDLAAEYSIETEAVQAAALASTSTTAIGYGTTPTANSVNAAVWAAVAQVYQATRGQGMLKIACAPDVLPVFAQLFAPYGPFNQFGQGFEANRFGQGQMGVISGVETLMSAGLTTGEAFLYSTAALECYEQRVGTLQIVEPSVLGLQVAYAGYFAPLKIIDGGIVPLTKT
jgi:HK97 family phage major capsid protein